MLKNQILKYDLQWFAKDGEGGEKTEPATAKKLKDAREEGKVAKSRELNSAFGLIVLFLCLKIFVSYVGQKLISIFTTAISLGISFINNISKNKKQFSKIGLLICSTAILFSKIGFANLVNLLYPILGMLGLVQVTLMVVKDNGNKGDGTMGT